uniref:sn-1-specific diacylglycerol lipase ABHD11 n=1 Tax=Spermophilus dauricus TaxID=99837 RepID=A0A8C9QQW9_SPEDA
MAQQTGRRVLTVDARNHGDSPHSPDVSYEAMCQDLQSLLPQLDLAPCALIGHSMGGKTAMLLALQRPELHKVDHCYISPLLISTFHFCFFKKWAMTSPNCFLLKRGEVGGSNPKSLFSIRWGVDS